MITRMRGVRNPACPGPRAALARDRVALVQCGAVSPPAVRLRTCPFREDQLRAFERDWRPRTAAPLRTCPFAQPQLPAYQARVAREFEQRPGVFASLRGGGLDAWA